MVRFAMPGKRSWMLAAVATAIAVAAPAAGAVATAYASSSSPQTVSGYGSNAKTYGDWSVAKGSASVRSQLSGVRYRFVNADDHGVYVKLVSGAQTLEGAALGTQGETSSSTGRAEGGWFALTGLPSHTFQVPAAYRPGKVRVDAAVRTCLSVPWRVDPCSSEKSLYTVTTFNS